MEACLALPGLVVAIRSEQSLAQLGNLTQLAGGAASSIRCLRVIAKLVVLCSPPPQHVRELKEPMDMVQALKI